MGRSAPSAFPSKPHTHRYGAFLLGETWVGGLVLAFSLLHRAGGRHKLATRLARVTGRGPRLPFGVTQVAAEQQALGVTSFF